MRAGRAYLEPGKVIAGFRVEELLGRGGMGAVYRAIQVRLGRQVALKVLAPEWAGDDEFQARFIRESEVAASLEHPNVLPVYDAGEEDGVLYLAMRYVEGEDLRALLKRERLSLERTVAIVGQVAGALDTAHQAGLVHRDVKPANILISKSGHAYLSDFGVAKRLATTGLTRTGSLVGTVDYCAPEQIEGNQIDGRTDVYALGCVTFHCLAGQSPFERDSDVAVIKAHLSDPVPDLTTVRPDLPTALNGVLATAMAKDTETRHKTAGALAEAMRQTLANGVAPETVVERPAPQTFPRRSPISARHRRRSHERRAAQGGREASGWSRGSPLPRWLPRASQQLL